jgi:ABC-type sugar transport system permease subunit
MAFLAAPLAIYLIFVIAPVIYSFVYSFTDYDGASSTYNFVGLANFRQALGSPYFWNALKNNAIWMGLFILVPTGLGLALAKMVDGIPGENLFKTIIYFPMTLSFVVVGLIWSWIYLPQGGMLNLLLDTVGLGALKRAWLGNPNTALYAIIAAASWQQTGFAMVLFLAGLRGIPPRVLEAAEVDGANGWQRFWHVIFPLLRSTTAVVISITVINSLRVFDLVYIVTQGGPNRASEVLGSLIYKELFWNFRVGYGSALSVILFLITLVVIVFYLRTMIRSEEAA